MGLEMFPIPIDPNKPQVGVHGPERMPMDRDISQVMSFGPREKGSYHQGFRKGGYEQP